MKYSSNQSHTPTMVVEVVSSQSHTAPKKACIKCIVNKHIKFSIDDLGLYFFNESDPVLYDAMLVAAAVEFCDKSLKRSEVNWPRYFELTIPVKSVPTWDNAKSSLLDALSFLTGDQWQIRFVQSIATDPTPTVLHLSLPDQIEGVIPYSDGLDSRAVHGILEQKLGRAIVRIRLGTTKFSYESINRTPFAAIPYKVKAGEKDFQEPSVRSRGFKFASISIIAARLAKTNKIYIPESGQGIMGPVLTAPGQIYPDYRTHPQFLKKMERYAKDLLGIDVTFVFPRLWHTKAQTISEYNRLVNTNDGWWKTTKSCWQQNRQVSVNGSARQCGICAACLFRRMSLHGAGLNDDPSHYVWENLGSSTFEEGCHSDFDRKKITKKMKSYISAGILHLDHLAKMRHSRISMATLDAEIFRVASSCGIEERDAKAKLIGMLMEHEKEWNSFLESLGRNSFINQWLDKSHE